jgi:acyl dehydratase
VIEWFDDLAVGMRFKSPEKVVTREEILRFASEFDPQPYHLDEEAAERTPLKGLAASGWHTAAIAMRLAVEVRPFGPHPLLGLGVDELRRLAQCVLAISFISKGK